MNRSHHRSVLRLQASCRSPQFARVLRSQKTATPPRQSPQVPLLNFFAPFRPPLILLLYAELRLYNVVFCVPLPSPRSGTTQASVVPAANRHPACPGSFFKDKRGIKVFTLVEGSVYLRSICVRKIVWVGTPPCNAHTFDRCFAHNAVVGQNYSKYNSAT